MKYTVVIEKTPNNYAAYVPDLPGCVATASTREDTAGGDPGGHRVPRRETCVKMANPSRTSDHRRGSGSPQSRRRGENSISSSAVSNTLESAFEQHATARTQQYSSMKSFAPLRPRRWLEIVPDAVRQSA